MRLQYLKENKTGMYEILLTNNKLKEHLIEIEKTAKRRIEQIVEQMKQQEQITEELKAKDQMTWVGKMNNIQATAEQIVIRELILA